MEFVMELALDYLLPVILPVVVAAASLIFCCIFAMKCKRNYRIYIAILSVVFLIIAVWRSLRFPHSMEGAKIARDLIPFLNVTFY